MRVQVDCIVYEFYFRVGKGVSQNVSYEMGAFVL